jgi:archaemetzincin
MKAIHLLAVNCSKVAPGAGADVTLEMLDELAGECARVLQVPCHVREDCLDASFAFNAGRGQYDSTIILQRLDSIALEPGVRILGVTGLDLYVPVLTFVFGEAQWNGRCAVVSVRRLREEFYGLPPNPRLLQERLSKEAIHELGHTLGLKHCFDWRCVMASSHSVERIDLKEAAFCSVCASRSLQPNVVT